MQDIFKKLKINDDGFTQKLIDDMTIQLKKNDSSYCEESSKKAHHKTIELAKTGEDYAYLGDWQKAIEIGTDERYLFWISISQGGPYFEDSAMKMLDMILENEKENGDSQSIADMSNNIYEDADANFERDEYGESTCDEDTFGDLISSWSEKLMKLAIEKSTTKEDEEYINELLAFQDMDIEFFKKE